MPVRDTSMIAFFDKVLPHLSDSQARVYKVFQRWNDLNFTNAEVARELGLPINHITPRTGELRDLGLIVECVRRRCRVTGNLSWAKRLKK